MFKFFHKRKRHKSPTDSVRAKHSPSVIDIIDTLLSRAQEKAIIEDYNSAVALTDKVLQLQPDNYSALICRATCLEALNYNLDAIEDYQKAIQIDNTDPNIYGLLGLTYRKIGYIDNGQKYLKLAVQNGAKYYEHNYNSMAGVSEESKLAMIRVAHIPKNLRRRNSDDFVDDLEVMDINKYNRAVKKQVVYLKHIMSLDPNNRELKELYKSIKGDAHE